MKKLLIGVITATTLTTNASHAAFNCCGAAPCMTAGAQVTYDSSCTDTKTCNCSSSTSGTNINGVQTTTNRSGETYCIGQTVYHRCNVGTSTYKCGSGYYGTATSAFDGCTKCPDNATCAGGNGSTFVCNKGYYKNGTQCSRCPSSGGVYGTTAIMGATANTECYLPSGTTHSDSTGSGTYTSNCYYKN